MERAPKKGGAAFAAVVMAMAVFATITTAQEFTEDEKALFVKLHNDARAEVGVSMPALSWDKTLAAKALEHASSCQKDHIPGPYGENLWWGRSFAANWNGSPADAMNFWVGEKRNYDHGSNSCVGGVCGHYTQVVWSRTTAVGCARVACNQGDIGVVISCNYNPRGNIEGESPY